MVQTRSHNEGVGAALGTVSKSGLREEVVIRAQAFIDRKYVARADARQREMGLGYVEAERQDLAREMARFVENELRISHATSAGIYEECAQIAEGESASFDFARALAECRDSAYGANSARKSVAAEIRAKAKGQA